MAMKAAEGFITRAIQGGGWIQGPGTDWSIPRQ